MNIGIVTTWFERGASYVSKQFYDILNTEHNVFIYARGGELTGKGNINWDYSCIHWAKKIYSPLDKTLIHKREFLSWLKINNINAVIFNEQTWWKPILWCIDLGIITVGYIDYYKVDTVRLFEIYDYIICNTKKHYSVFYWHPNALMIPWGTDTELYRPRREKSQLLNTNCVTFFHSSGMSPYRKGTDIVIKAFYQLKVKAKLIIHTQVDLFKVFPQLEPKLNELLLCNKLVLITKTVSAPGLYYLGDVYVYPSRLEGIGLTIAEALASGLPCIVPDQAPMNEFVKPNHGSLVQVDKLFRRADDYYWPQCEVSIEQLTEIMTKYSTDVERVLTHRKNARNFAVQNLNWRKNSIPILKLFSSNIDISKSKKNNAKTKIKIYEAEKKRRLNRYFILLSPMMRAFHKMFL